jgi:pimeloyl-ACP methyl ester carboxylesterase
MYDVLGLSVKHFEDWYAQALMKSVGAADRTVLSDAAVLAAFLAASRECFRHGAAGLVADATMLYETWPFDMSRLDRPVHIWQGDADTLVPAAINEEVADRTPGAVWHPVSGGGHFIAVSHASDVLASAAADLAATAA